MSKELQDWIQHLAGRSPLNVMGNTHPMQEELSEGRGGFEKAPKEKHNVLCLRPGFEIPAHLEELFERACVSACHFRVTWTHFGLL